MNSTAPASSAGPPPSLDAEVRGIVVRNIEKRYPGVQALEGVDFSIVPGEVRALLGKNGAGKSTLVKILGGIVQPDAGELRLDGQPIILRSPLVARMHGIAVVHQELSIVPELTVAENVYLGRWSEQSGRAGFIDSRKLEHKARQELVRLGIDLDPGEKAGRLSIAHQQVVEIARALSYRPSLLILDEPTSSLPATEVALLLALVRRLAAQGIAVIYVSHRMDEIPQVADSITVLRDGKHVSTGSVTDCTTSDVIRLMTGGSSSEAVPRERRQFNNDVVLRVENLTTPAKLEGISFEIYRGEILGLAGLLGSGRTELLRALYGLDASSGEIELLGTPVSGGPGSRLAAGLGFAPEDRKKEALALDMSVSNNLVMACRSKVSRAGFLLPQKESKIARNSIEELSIKALPSSAVRVLSGGNQQKVVLGKSLNAGIKVFLMDEPTRGVDIEAKGQIYALLRSLSSQGMAVLVASSEVEELFLICDRLLVLSRGRLVAEKSVGDTTIAQVMALSMEGLEL